MLDVLRAAGLATSDQVLLAAVSVKHGTNGNGKRIDYCLHYSGAALDFTYDYGKGRDLLTGRAVSRGGRVSLGPWDLAIMKEDK
jgi:beta-galactosidase